MKKPVNNFLLGSLFLCSLLYSSLSFAEENLNFRDLERKVELFELTNGLKVIFLKRDVAPVFSSYLWVKVGGVDEVPGRTGVSHFLEHMAFKGTKTIGTKDYSKEEPLLKRLEEIRESKKWQESDKLNKEVKNIYKKLESLWIDNEFSKLYEQRGGSSLNASTGKDFTNYKISLPSSEFEFWCWMESERLLNPVFRQFYKEREVVGEERRSSSEDSPDGVMYENMLALSFKMHPNRLPVIGWASDISSLSPGDLRQLYKKYYRPDNMVVVLVGDLEIAEVKENLEKYFGRIKAKKGEIPEIRTIETPQPGQRELTINFNAKPQLLLAYHKPTMPNPDDATFGILHSVLAEGRTSRLYKKLVIEKRIATSVYTSEGPGERYDNLFYISATPVEGVSNETLKNEIEEVLSEVRENGITDEELRRAKQKVKVSFLDLLDSNSGLAYMFGRYQLLWGDWKKLFVSYESFLATNKDDVRTIVAKYLTKDKQNYIHLETKVN